MTLYATAINPIVLRWARERSGYSVEDIAHRHKQPSETVIAWEDGHQVPTFRQLEDLAKSYKRPVAVFFFPEPPPEKELESEFRTLPNVELGQLLPDTRFAIREARARQQSLSELTSGRNPSGKFILREVQPRGTRPVRQLVSQARAALGVGSKEQKEWSNNEQAFKRWRQALENVGVFVFKRSFKQQQVSGFCLWDDEFPVIVINNSTRFARQTFTLFHELAHLFFGTSGITKGDSLYIERLSGVDKIEVFCNRFAAEFLVPEKAFPWHVFEERDLRSALASVAKEYSVSREVILRRLLDHDKVSEQTYQKLISEWPQDRGGEGGGSYYPTQVAYLGDAYLQLAFSRYHAGTLSLTRLADHLDIKARNIGKLSEYLNEHQKL